MSKKRYVDDDENSDNEFEESEDYQDAYAFDEVEHNVLKAIVGQDQQVRTLLTTILKSSYFVDLKSNILVIGKSGTGKTETIKQIAENLELPCVIEDANEYTQAGYVGSNVDDIVYHLIQKANCDLEMAEHGIVVIEEKKKKAGRNNIVGRDISGRDVLNSLLKIIEGKQYTINMSFTTEDGITKRRFTFDTSKIIFIFLGAFSGLDEIRDKRIGKNKIGIKVEKSDEIIGSDPRVKYTKHDLVEYGMPEEFVGRIDTIVEMNDLTKENLASILQNSKLSIFKKYEENLSLFNIKLEYDPKIFEEIASVSMEVDTGARELSNTVNYVFEKIMYEVLSGRNLGNCTCTLDLDIVHDNSKYTWSW